MQAIDFRNEGLSLSFSDSLYAFLSIFHTFSFAVCFSVYLMLSRTIYCVISMLFSMAWVEEFVAAPYISS